MRTKENRAPRVPPSQAYPAVDRQTVVVLGEESGTDRPSSRRVQNRWAHALDVEGDRVIRFRELLCHWPDPEQPPAMRRSAD